MSPHYDPELEDSEQSSCIALWPMMTHHHIMFGYQKFSSLGVIVHMIIC